MNEWKFLILSVWKKSYYVIKVKKYKYYSYYEIKISEEILYDCIADFFETNIIL